MKLIMLVSNNLQYDTRVKRHLSTLTKEFDEVLLSARPIPDDQTYLSFPNLTYTFFDWEPYTYPATKKLRNALKEIDMFDDIWPVAPAILDEHYYEPDSLDFEKQLQDTLMDTPQWKEVLAGIPEVADLAKQMGWVFGFLDCAIQWARDVVSESADVIYCNDIDTLLAGVAHKRRYHSRLIYDAHDIYCDMFPGIFPRMHRNMLALLERQLLQYVDVLLGVSQSELSWMNKTYQVNIPQAVIHNCTEDITQDNHIKKTYKLPLRLYYHGNADPTRGIGNAIDAVALVPDVVFHIRCLPGSFLDALKEKVRAMGLNNRVFFLAPVPGTEAAAAARRDGDIGIHACSTEKSVDIEISLTNKFIEYLKAGLPVITSPIREQAQIIQQYDAGFVLNDDSAKSIAYALDQAVRQIKKLPRMSRNALRASTKLFDWSVYRERLVCLVTGRSVPKLPQHNKANDESLILRHELAAWKKVARMALESRSEATKRLKEEYAVRLSLSAQLGLEAQQSTKDTNA